MKGTERIALVLRHDRYAFAAKGAGRLPVFAGSAWRGAFGHALKRTVCVMRLRPCEDCPLVRSCIYPTVFEAAPDVEGGRLVALERVAQPYVLMPPAHGPHQIAPGDAVALGVTLVGRAAGHRAYVQHALEAAAADGLGPQRVPLALADIVSTAIEPNLPATRSIRLELRTPLRLKCEGRLVGADALRPRDFLMALVRRVSMLRAFHDEAPLNLDFAGLKQRAEGLAWRERAVRWAETVRWSSRQRARLQMGGLVGSVVLDASEAAPFRPFLALAPWIGIGKGASMGLGQIAVGPA